MNSTNFFYMSMASMLTQLPVLAVCTAGLIVAIIRRQRAPKAAPWAIAAFGLALFLCGAVPTSQALVFQFYPGTMQARVSLNLVFSVVWSLLRAGTYVLLFVGVFADREPASPGQYRRPE